MEAEDHEPTMVLCIGMAGSGKTTFVQRLNAEMHAAALLRNKDAAPEGDKSGLPEQGLLPYVINLDPAVLDLPYEPNIDIRDTVDYRTVMKEYRLGPNGAIMTALNLFTTKFDQVLGILEGKKQAQQQQSLGTVLIDTPGQIEVFTWSASGAIIMDALSLRYPTVVAYVVDVPRCASPATFMANMLYACSILYRTQLPLILVLNKTDVTPATELMEWMQDWERLQAAIGEDAQLAESYSGSLIQSMGLVLEEFYRQIPVVPFSAFTGEGFSPEWQAALTQARRHYWTHFAPAQERAMAERQARTQQGTQEQLARLLDDLRLDKEKNLQEDE